MGEPQAIGEGETQSSAANNEIPHNGQTISQNGLEEINSGAQQILTLSGQSQFEQSENPELLKAHNSGFVLETESIAGPSTKLLLERNSAEQQSAHYSSKPCKRQVNGDVIIGADNGSGEASYDGSSKGPSGISVTVLTLEAGAEWRPRSRRQTLLRQLQQQHPPADSAMKDAGELSDVKLIRDFQVRRKYGRRPTHTPLAAGSPRDKMMLDLGLAGVKYFNNGNSINGRPTTSTYSSNQDQLGPEDYSRSAGKNARLLSDNQSKSHHHKRNAIHRVQNASSPALLFSLGEHPSDHKSDVDKDKDVPSPSPPSSSSFPPLSSPPRGLGTRSENSSYLGSRYGGGEKTSLLLNHFGFTTIRPDTFSGIQRHRKLKVAAATGNDALMRELEQHAQRQILACQNMGYTHRGSRAADSVLSLKQTVSPSAFHPSPIFTRHPTGGFEKGLVPRMGSPGEGSEKNVRRITHPPPGGKLSVPRLLITDRQDQRNPQSRRSTLPSVNGNSLQVVLAETHAK